jgi:hypothetical protein
MGWDEGRGWNRENWTTTIVPNFYTCWKLCHTPKAFEEAKKVEDDWREKREGDWQPCHEEAPKKFWHCQMSKKESIFEYFYHMESSCPMDRIILPCIQK